METYSVTSHFGGVEPNIGQLHNEILANVNILETLKGIIKTLDIVDIFFDATLSGPEKTELDTLVSNHVPVYTPNLPEKMTITSRKNSLKNKTYTRLGTGLFLGSTYAKAKCISYMDSSVTSYDIEIFDKDNHQILLTATLTNTSESVQDLGVLSNVPASLTQVEVSAKKNGGGGGKVYIESVTICYA